MAHQKPLQDQQDRRPDKPATHAEDKRYFHLTQCRHEGAKAEQDGDENDASEFVRSVDLHTIRPFENFGGASGEPDHPALEFIEFHVSRFEDSVPGKEGLDQTPAAVWGF